MYTEIISEAVKYGYKGLSYYRYNRDEFYFGSNLLAMSDDYNKYTSNYKHSSYEDNGVGIIRNNGNGRIINNNADKKTLYDLLDLIGIHEMYNNSPNEKNTVLGDIQSVYYVINHIYIKALDIIAKRNPLYVVINKQPLSACIIDETVINNLTEEEKQELKQEINILFTSHLELSKNFDQVISKIKIACDFDDKNLDNLSIEDFMSKITKLKSTIESLNTKELLNYKNEIIKIKNAINALEFLKRNKPEKYLQFSNEEEELRKKLKELMLKMYLFVYKNKNVFRFNEIIKYFSDILLDPQLLSSRKFEEKSLCEETYEEILNDINENKIPEINDKDDFKVFTLRASAVNFCQYRLLYTYENGNPLCRLEVYNEIIKRFLGDNSDRIIRMIIDQITKEDKYSSFDSFICSDENLKKIIFEKELTKERIVELIKIFNKIDCLDTLIQFIPENSIDSLEEEIINQMNEGNVNSGRINNEILYKEFVKRR